MTSLSSLTTDELLQELAETESQLKEFEQLGINYFLGVAGYLPDTTELSNYRSQLVRELEQRR